MPGPALPPLGSLGLPRSDRLLGPGLRDPRLLLCLDALVLGSLYRVGVLLAGDVRGLRLARLLVAERCGEPVAAEVLPLPGQLLGTPQVGQPGIQVRPALSRPAHRDPLALTAAARIAWRSSHVSATVCVGSSSSP